MRGESWLPLVQYSSTESHLLHTAGPHPELDAGRVSRCVKVGNDFPMQDLHSIEGYKEWMLNKMEKAAPDSAKISDTMARTFTVLRKGIQEEKPSVADIFAAYPALYNKKQT